MIFSALTLVACGKFVLERITVDARPYSVPADDRFRIVAAIKANNGEVWRYPMSFRFLK